MNARIEQGKKEILADIADGTIPTTPKNFNELHDFVDANEYAGLCDDNFYEKFLTHEDYLRFSQTVQEHLDAWIVKGMVN
jgi:hypothetical protein